MFIFRLFFNYVLLVGLLLGTGTFLMAWGSGYSLMDMYAYMNNAVVIVYHLFSENQEMVGCLYELKNGEYIKVCGDALQARLQ